MTLVKKKNFGNSLDKTDEQLTLMDCIVVKYDTEKNENVVTFPTLCVCSVCEGYSYVYLNGRSYNRPDLAAQVALIQYGHSYLKRCDNTISYRPCSCKQEEAKLVSEFNNLPITVIGDWKESYIGRCLRRYDLVFDTSEQLNDEAKELARKYLSIKKKAPNNTAIIQIKPNSYLLTCEVDSSD